MRNFKFRGFIPAVTKYVKSKPLFEVVAEVIAFGVLLPFATSGIVFMLYTVIFVGVWFSLINIIMISLGQYCYKWKMN